MNDIKEDAIAIQQKVDFTPLRGRSVLVTGGSGLLGQYIAATLQNLPDIELHVQCQSKPQNVDFYPDTRLYYANLANVNDCARLPNADVVIWASAYAQPLRFLADPLMALRSSSYGIMALLEKCNVGGRFLYISSSEVYCGCPSKPPFREAEIGTITPYHPRACYIEAKKFGEAITYLYRQRGISTVAVRPGILYGPGAKYSDQRSWVSFIRRAFAEKEIRLMDRGQVVRTFGYITDGMELLFNALIRGTQPVYNISGHSALSIAELAQVIGRVAGVPVIVPEEDHGVAGTPENLQLNTDLIENEFDKRSFVDFETGISRTVEWWRETYAT